MFLQELLISSKDCADAKSSVHSHRHAGHSHYTAVSVRQVLAGVLQLATKRLQAWPIRELREQRSVTPFEPQPDAKLSQLRFWQRISHVIKPGDLIIAESGTSSAGLNGLSLPEDVTFISQPIWGAIGFTLPALLGSLMAQPQRRQMLSNRRRQPTSWCLSK